MLLGKTIFMRFLKQIFTSILFKSLVKLHVESKAFLVKKK